MLLNTIAATAGVLLFFVTGPLTATTVSGCSGGSSGYLVAAYTAGETACATNTRAMHSVLGQAVSPAGLWGELRVRAGDAMGKIGVTREDTSGTYNFALLRSAMAALPEPKTMFLVGTALVALSLLGNKRRES